MPFQWQSKEIVPARNLQHALSLSHGGFGGGGFHGGFGGGGGCGVLPHPIANGTPTGTMAAGVSRPGGAGAPRGCHSSAAVPVAARFHQKRRRLRNST
jgi:hypothetical protein